MRTFLVVCRTGENSADHIDRCRLHESTPQNGSLMVMAGKKTQLMKYYIKYKLDFLGNYLTHRRKQAPLQLVNHMR